VVVSEVHSMFNQLSKDSDKKDCVSIAIAESWDVAFVVVRSF
jgi:hypothetical protein